MKFPENHSVLLIASTQSIKVSLVQEYSIIVSSFFSPSIQKPIAQKWQKLRLVIFSQLIFKVSFPNYPLGLPMTMVDDNFSTIQRISTCKWYFDKKFIDSAHRLKRTHLAKFSNGAICNFSSIIPPILLQKTTKNCSIRILKDIVGFLKVIQ